MSETIAKKTYDATSDGESGTFVSQLPSLTVQAERLIATGLLDEDGGSPVAEELRDAAVDLQRRVAPGALLVVSEQVLPARALIPHVRRTDGGRQREGFIVVDMEDVDDFVPTAEATIPNSLVYAIEDPQRGMTCATGLRRRHRKNSQGSRARHSPCSKVCTGRCSFPVSWTATPAT